MDVIHLTDAERAGALTDSFAVDAKIGEGSYGSVFRARHLRTSATVAIKKVPIDGDLPDLMQEIAMLSTCDSPAIIHLFGFFVEPRHLWMVMEYCSGGSVSDIIKQTGRTLSERQIAVVVRDTLLGLEYLHHKGKLHRDIKAGNILIDRLGQAKLADFGVAGQLTDAATKRNTVIGTPFWMSEVVQEIGYTTKADMWSLGITCIEMAEGHPPNHNVNPMRFIFMIPTRPPPKLADLSLWTPLFPAFVARCLVKNPDMRPTATELLMDPFVAGATDHAELRDLAAVTMAERERVWAEGGGGAVGLDSEDDEDGEEEDGKTVADTMRGPLDNIHTMRPGRAPGTARRGRMHLVLPDASKVGGGGPSSLPLDDPASAIDRAVEEVTYSTGTMIVHDSSEDLPISGASANIPQSVATGLVTVVGGGPVFPISSEGTIRPMLVQHQQPQKLSHRPPPPIPTSSSSSSSGPASMALSLDRSPPSKSTMLLNPSPMGPGGASPASMALSLDRSPTFPNSPTSSNSGGPPTPNQHLHSLLPSSSSSSLRSQTQPERPERNAARRSPSMSRRGGASPASSPNPPVRGLPTQASGPGNGFMPPGRVPSPAALAAMAGHRRTPSPGIPLPRRPSKDKMGGMQPSYSAPSLNVAGGWPPRRRSEDPPRMLHQHQQQQHYAPQQGQGQGQQQQGYYRGGPDGPSTTVYADGSEPHPGVRMNSTGPPASGAGYPQSQPHPAGGQHHVPYRVRHASSPHIYQHHPTTGQHHQQQPLSAGSQTSAPPLPLPPGTTAIEDPRTGNMVVFERRGDSLRNLAQHHMQQYPHPGAPAGSPRPPVAVHASGFQQHQQPLRKMPSAGHLPPPPLMSAAGAPPVPIHYQQQQQQQQQQQYQQQQQQQQQLPPPRQRNRSISRDPNTPPTRSNSGPHPGMMASPTGEFSGYVYPTSPAGAGEQYAPPGGPGQGAYQQGPPQHPHYPPPPLPADAYGGPGAGTGAGAGGGPPQQPVVYHRSGSGGYQAQGPPPLAPIVTQYSGGGGAGGGYQGQQAQYGGGGQYAQQPQR